MVWLVLIFVGYVLPYSTVPVAGQCTVSSYSVSLSGPEEKLQFNLEEHDHRLETMNQNMCSAFEKLEAVVNKGLSSALQTVNRSLGEKLQVMQVQFQDQSSSIQTANRNLDNKVQVMNGSVVGALREHDKKLQTMNETLSSAIDQINEKLNVVLDYVNENLQHLRCQNGCRNTSDVCDCSDIKANGCKTNGVYRIYVVDQGQHYYANASCDMTTTNGPWTVFQRRKDGSVDFYRGWSEYANGFGDPNGEFWIGNDFLHLMTSKRRYRLRIDLEDFEGEKRHAEYSTFNISSSADKYRLRINNYSGTAGDSLSYLNGQRFSTKDSDNDAWGADCAVRWIGAWWYNQCSDTNLNGLYLHGRYSSNGSFDGWEGIYWHYWHGKWYSLKTTEMKISSS